MVAAISDAVEIDQIVGLDVTRLAQPGDDCLDQLRVIFREFNSQRSDALAASASHAQLLGERTWLAVKAGPVMHELGFSSAATARTRKVGGRCRPDPPSSTQMRVNDRLQTIVVNMVFSFEKGNSRSLTGNSVPVRGASSVRTQRLGDATGRRVDRPAVRLNLGRYKVGHLGWQTGQDDLALLRGG